MLFALTRLNLGLFSRYLLAATDCNKSMRIESAVDVDMTCEFGEFTTVIATKTGIGSLKSWCEWPLTFKDAIDATRYIANRGFWNKKTWTWPRTIIVMIDQRDEMIFIGRGYNGTMTVLLEPKNRIRCANISKWHVFMKK